VGVLMYELRLGNNVKLDVDDMHEMCNIPVGYY